jgi:formamidopyrimidine-DNA glycosylase
LLKRALRRRVATVEVCNPHVIVGSADDFVQSLAGVRLESVARKGKALAIELAAQNGSTPRYLLVHLGMTGQFTVVPQNRPLELHTHVRMLFEDGAEEIRYRDPRRFGRLRCCTRQELDAIFAGLGPDAPEIAPNQFVQAMRGRRGAIKGWLMNQKMLAGLGNIYADEALFEAGIHPLARPARITEAAARRLHRAVRRVLARALAFQGTSFRDYIDIEGRPGNFQPRLKVYQRTGEPCRRCGRSIRRIIVAGRSSHFCPNCQPRPRHVAATSRTRAVLGRSPRTRTSGPKREAALATARRVSPLRAGSR